MRVLALVAASVGAAGAQAGLVFNFAHDPGMDANAVAGFTSAGARWSSLFSDSMTVNISIDFKNLGGSILGQAASSRTTESYSSVRGALVTDAKSADDFAAIGSLQSGSSLSVNTNRWKNSPTGSGSATPYMVALSNMSITTANAKALGLLSGSDPSQDAAITFNSSFSWDWDGSNGIGGGQYDFVGIAAHEIGHALGFISGVDMLEYNYSNFNDNGFAWVSSVDLFRYQAGSTIPYLCADNTSKYFSLDNGATGSSNLFSNGTVFGDGRQASHWKDNLGLGILDPTAANGELLQISALDITAFDAIGYDAVPEPATMIGLSIGALAVLARRRKR